MADDVTIKFGADIADLKGKVDEVLNIFGGLTSKFAEMAAVVGGGAAFKKFIDETVTLNTEAVKLSKILGITGEAAGTLNTALGDIGADADTYTGAFLHFNRALRQNGDEMKAMGVDIDGLRSGQKDSNQVMLEAVQIIGQYKPGIDQTQAAMKLFGRSVEDVYKLMKLTPEIIEAARKKNQELNLTITQEGVEASRKYKLAMNDVGDVLKGVSKTIGEGVMPHFTAMAEQLASTGPTIVAALKPAVQTLINIWETLGQTVLVIWGVIRDDVLLPLRDLWQGVFGHDGPGAMEIFNNALKVIEMAFIGFRIVFELSASMIKTGLSVMSEYFVRFAEVSERALHFDLTGAKAAWQAGVTEHNRILEEGIKDAIRIAEKGQVDLDAVANRSTTTQDGTPAGMPKGGGKTMKLGKNGGDQEKLAAQLALLKAGNEAAKNLELEYLKEAESMYDEAFKNNLLSTAEYYAARGAIEVKAFDVSLDAKRKELADAQKAEADAASRAGSASKPEERNKYEAQAIKFKTEQVKLLGDINVLEAQRTDSIRKNGAEQADAERKLNDDLLLIRANREKANVDAAISNEEALLAQQASLRQIDAQQQFDAERALENRSFTATQAFLAAKRSTIHGDDLRALAQQAADEEAAEVAHQAKLTQIDRAATLERAKYSLEAQQSIESGFATMVTSLLNGTKTIGDAIRGFGIAVAQAFENLIAKRFAERLFGAGSVGGNLIDQLTQPFVNAISTIAAKWLGAEIAQTAATETESSARTIFRTGEIAAQTDAAVVGAGITAGAEKTASIAGVMAWASTAAAAAMASVAAIPFYGWAMAPEVGAATYADAMGYAALASAEGGWGSVTHDGALTELHKKEMVLPRFLSEGVRQMAEPGALQSVVAAGVNQQQGAQAAAGDAYHFTIHAVDAQSVKRLFEEHGSALVSALKKQNRNFAF